MKKKTIVLAENVSDVVVITPRTLNRTRGVVAREVLATRDVAGQLGYRALWAAIEPCFATTPKDGGAGVNPPIHANRTQEDS